MQIHIVIPIPPSNTGPDLPDVLYHDTSHQAHNRQDRAQREARRVVLDQPDVGTHGDQVPHPRQTRPTDHGQGSERLGANHGSSQHRPPTSQKPEKVTNRAQAGTNRAALSALRMDGLALSCSGSTEPA